MVILLIGLAAVAGLIVIYNKVRKNSKLSSVHKEIDEVQLDQEVAKTKETLKKERKKLNKLEEKV